MEALQKENMTAMPLNDSPRLTREEIQRFLDSLAVSGKTEETVKNYARSLEKLYNWLPDGKWITADLLSEWRDAMMEEGCAPGTVNMRTSAVNTYLAYVGRRDLQLLNQLQKAQVDAPEMRRSEYLRLLGTARALNDKSTYFIIKLFGVTGIRAHDMPKVTVEAAQAGEIKLVDETLWIPESLRKELLAYAKTQGRRTGPLISTRDGRPMSRTQMNKQIERICRSAQVPVEKANPKCIRSLYQRTYEKVSSNITLLIRQAYEHLLETEQDAIGWGTR